MTAETEEQPTSTADRPDPRRRLKAMTGWVVVAALVLVGVVVATQVATQMPGGRGGLDPEGVGDSGTRALAELLRDQGVEIEVVRSRSEVRAALDSDSTLAMANPYTLTDEGVADLIEPADRVVFLSASTHLVASLGLGDNATSESAEVEADCDVTEFARVGAIRPDRVFTPDPGVQGCFGTRDAAAVLIGEVDGQTRTVVEGARLFSNAYLVENGNAALGLALLGQTEKVVWYVPSFTDTDIEAAEPDTLGSLTPEWVTPAILMLMLAALAAGLWRGQRFGPLVAETLPVTVRASETMLGRARLTAKAGDAAHAAEAIRDGSRRRLARRLGLAVQASADEVADAASDRLRIPRGSLQTLLAGPLPTDDAGLVELARRLSELERAVDDTLREMRRAE
ncbi:hypothetical protein AUC47_01925 [Microbacterium sp. SZ1]|uniref:DUF4350 domain-containing protein n=1 Tax=Microbacterium sp. SZ1 TaxID=1849736 RepID=UPI000BBB9B32|nr:DUF4350 domain-containing protein [Microbacterium sp. SZ1]PCE14924.1 hypothetical protein AUC47_01925 [Microbacterium sp. SZ1]